MINSKDDVLELLNEYVKTQHEFICQLWSGNETWSGKRQAIYMNGVVLGKFRERDTATISVFKEGVTDLALYNEIKLHLESDIKLKETKEQLDIMDEELLKVYIKQLKDLQLNPIDDWILNNCQWIKKDTKDISYSEMKVLLFLYYAFENNERQKRHSLCSDLNELAKEYKDVFDKRSQFSKYGIVPIDSERELLTIEPPHVYDKTIDKTFFTKNVPLNLLNIFSEMIDRGIITDFSVRLVNEAGYSGRLYSEYIAEALEIGKLFDFVNLGDYSVSKLYSKEYEDCMWVVIDDKNITFEELCKDFEVYNDMIVTQVVHLQYELERENAYITHLDHEYIFYTIDEYDSRTKDTTQKGEAKARLKSFKIDNARIPFEYRCKVLRKDENGNDLPFEDEQFLCYVLECYFKHKDLLKEYFHKLSQ